MKPPAFVWTCPACGALVRTELPPADEAVLRCSSCGKVFGEGREPAANEPRAERRAD
ncbi:MAG TPA: lysine biosynthesis protein LysW [Thermoanaerobaculia bacterium]|jgi:uncharacterized Zn finger protein|nr:lysine biosynthesis protein LysW [Thermoanaerobaculia bacterium]